MTKLGSVAFIPEYLNLLILQGKNEFAKHKSKNTYPCYRTILCHAIIHYFLSQADSSDFSEAFNECIDFLQKNINANECIDMKNFVEILSVEKGKVLIDHSRGFYPLVLWDTKKEESKNSRLAAFEMALSDLHKNKEKYIKFIGGSLSALKNEKYYWNDRFQEELQKKFI